MASRRFDLAASRLLSLVVATDADDAKCALARAGDVGSMTERASALGFTEREAWEIMSGWDTTYFRSFTLWGDRLNQLGRRARDLAGFKLGQLAFHLAFHLAKEEHRV